MSYQANNQKRDFILLCPIYNLNISKNIGNEVQIERVHILSIDKIPRVRKKLGFKSKISEINKRYIKHNLPKLFENITASSFATIKVKRAPQDELINPMNKVKDALWILASSQFGNRRDMVRYFGLPEYQANIINEFYLYDSNEKKSLRSFDRIAPLPPYTLDKTWKSYMKKHFFFYLLNILNRKIEVDAKWKKNIRSVAILAGKSHFSKNLPLAFLYNMIAIDNLLSSRGERYPNCLIDRLNVLFGWVTGENWEAWKPLIKRLYRLRNEMVHSGDTMHITTKDLIESDNILFNLLYNICRFIKRFPQKKSLVDLSNKVNARRILGQRIKERPNIRYLHNVDSNAIISRIKKKNNWP